MKKSQLRNIIRESIGELMTEHTYTTPQTSGNLQHTHYGNLSPGPDTNFHVWEYWNHWNNAYEPWVLINPGGGTADVNRNNQAFNNLGGNSVSSGQWIHVDGGANASCGTHCCIKYMGPYSLPTLIDPGQPNNLILDPFGGGFGIGPGLPGYVPPPAPFTNSVQWLGVNWNIDAGPFNSEQDCTNPQLTVYGCTDSQANNYDSNATQDDGSCDYGWKCGQLSGGGAVAEQVSMPTGCFPGTSTDPGVFYNEGQCLSQNTNIPNGCGGTDMGMKKAAPTIEPTIDRMKKLAKIK